MSSGISGVMSALKAEVLLGESQLFDQIKKLCSNLTYSTEDGKFAFDDYLKTLVDAIDAIPKLELDNDVAPGTETVYTIQLTQSAEGIVDECDRIFRRLNQFEGKLREAERKVNNQKAEFVAWYMLAAITLFKDLDDIKLPMAEIRKLAEAEFSRLMGGLDVAVLTMIDAIKIETSKVSQHKAAQKEKYNLGKDQANATWTSTLPAFGNAFTEDRGSTTGVQEMDEEEVPAPVKRSSSIIGDTLRIIKPEDNVKGTFVKTGDPKPASVVEYGDECPDPKEVRCGKTMCHRHDCLDCYPPDRHYNKFMDGEVPKPSPRKRLVFDDEDEVV